MDDALKVIRSALASGMAWKELKQLVKDEKARRNPVALAIEQLKLETNKISLLLRLAAARRTRLRRSVLAPHEH